MMMYNALISLADQYEYQSRADAFYDPQTKLWQPLFLIADTGWSLGLPSIGNVGNVNEFTPWFTKRWNDHIFIFWLSLFLTIERGNLSPIMTPSGWRDGSLKLRLSK